MLKGGRGGSVSQPLDLALVAHCVDVDPQNVPDETSSLAGIQEAPDYGSAAAGDGGAVAEPLLSRSARTRCQLWQATT